MVRLRNELPVAVQITNLLHRYADCIDSADFEGGADLFAYGALLSGGQRFEGREAIVALWRSFVRLYDDGTPKTRHIITNPIIGLSPDGEEATSRSQWTVLQAAPGFPLQVIGSGRYHDRFRQIDGAWHFTLREYAQIDLAGDFSAHLLQSYRQEDA